MRLLVGCRRMGRRTPGYQVDSVTSSPESGPLLRGDDALVTVVDGAVLGAVFWLDGVGVVPVVDVVDVAVVEPEAGVVGMVGALAGERVEGIAAGEGGAVGRDQRVEHGLALVGAPQVGGEGLAVDGDVDAVLRFVGDDLRRRPLPGWRRMAVRA